MDDVELMARFENCRLSHEEWTHRAHVRVAYLYLCAHPFEAALGKVRSGIQALNAVHQVPEGPTRGYNETTTRAFLQLIAATREAYGATFPTPDSDTFCDTHPQLMTRHVLRLFYSPGQRMHPDAKYRYVPPDLSPLPPVEASGPLAEAATPFPVLETERLLLRAATPADTDAVFAVLSDPEVCRFTDVIPLTSRDHALRIIEHRAARFDLGTGIRWGLARRDDGVLIGSCGYTWDRGQAVGEIGFELRRASWGQGFMAEALRAALDYGFETAGLHRIEAQVMPENAASLRLLAHLGFEDEGLLRGRGRWKGAFHDLRMLAQLHPSRNFTTEALRHREG